MNPTWYKYTYTSLPHDYILVSKITKENGYNKIFYNVSFIGQGSEFVLQKSNKSEYLFTSPLNRLSIPNKKELKEIELLKAQLL